MLEKPDDMFDRDWEWQQLGRFVSDDREGATLGIMSGRRRQGKTFLLEAACEATGGFYHAATEAVPREEALRQLAASVASYLGTTGDLSFTSWEQAIDALLALGEQRSLPVVLDEFPYMTQTSKDLPSVIQKALAPRRTERRRSKARLLLCGSSISFMGKLLSGQAPLRGRAGLELVVPTFDFRRAAEYWGLRDHHLAALVYFIVGGTPAYRSEYLQDAAPEDLDDFDRWVVEHVLNPASPLFREVRSLLAEDPSLHDTGLYTTVLAAVAEGNATRGGIANRIGRKSADISHHLTVLSDAGFLVADDDAFRSKRSYYRITEPLVRFHHAIMRPQWAALEQIQLGRTERIWEASQSRFRSNVAGPVFEHMCRTWVQKMAAERTIGDLVTRCLSGVVHDQKARTGHEVDVAAFNAQDDLLAIGEVKWGEVMDTSHLERLRTIAEVLDHQERAPRTLLLFSGQGFTSGLTKAATNDPGVELVDLDRLYTGE